MQAPKLHSHPSAQWTLPLSCRHCPFRLIDRRERAFKTYASHIFTALLRKPVVRADNPFVYGADCLPPKPLYQVAEIKVETLNVVEKVQTNIVGKTAFDYIGRKIVGQLFLKKEYSRTQAMLQVYWSKYSWTLDFVLTLLLNVFS